MLWVLFQRPKVVKEVILLATNYMNKWVETMTTSLIKAKDVVQFIYHNNCIRFGVLLEIVLEWSIISSFEEEEVL